MNAIQLKSVSKTYLGTNKPAVNDINLSVKQGDIITLLGPSGCGKSTTLRLIAGFERTDSGSISLAENLVSDKSKWVPPENRGVGMVFQDFALFPHLDVFNNVGFGYKSKDRTKRVKEVLELVGLSELAKRYPHELSGGQQQRVALARALARRPVVVLLDEPFSSLDADLRVQMRLEVKRIIKEAGATAVLVSHDQKDALAISDRIVVIKDGVIQQNGTPREIYQNPANKFVANFVGETNILKGVVVEGEACVATSFGTIPCRNTPNIKAKEQVYVSIRPGSIKKDENGPFEGRVLDTIYTGQNIDAKIEVDLGNGTKQSLLMHFHPDEIVNDGDIVRFRVLPDFVAVV
ncbi:ABC transporter ATP-binding protein [Proteinivorax tanatarense]|uniref:ABC-type quaternary amine transporter n=1 Tax=Proteinivorax tanatarense TaxID=1260629 RepID=A0AAU7VLB5_9FIRM